MATILKGGKIYDGSGRDAFVGDIRIEADRITGVSSEMQPEQGDDIIDVSGLSATGFRPGTEHLDTMIIFSSSQLI